MRLPVTPPLVALVLGCCLSGIAQTAVAPTVASAALTADQQSVIADAGRDLRAQNWAGAIAKLAPLLQALPNNDQVVTMFAEADINAGKPAEATSVLSRLLASSPQNVPALATLAHAQAAQRQWQQLEGTLKTLRQIHDARQSKLNQITLGDEALPNIGHVQWLYFLDPSWSHYNVYSMARVLGQDGAVRERITLESGDGDQPLFAAQHPQDAAKGLRSFSLDGYVNTDEHTQTHYTYAFFVGQPSFETFRNKVLAVTAGTLKPVSSRNNLTMPSSK